MYAALAGEDQRKTALDTARTLADEWIDDGNSRAYLLAWLMTVRARGGSRHRLRGRSASATFLAQDLSVAAFGK